MIWRQNCCWQISLKFFSLKIVENKIFRFVSRLYILFALFFFASRLYMIIIIFNDDDGGHAKNTKKKTVWSSLCLYVYWLTLMFFFLKMVQFFFFVIIGDKTNYITSFLSLLLCDNNVYIHLKCKTKKRIKNSFEYLVQTRNTNLAMMNR